MSSPSVTAVMLTGKCRQRAHMADVAYDCFLKQTYRGLRTLLIVNQDHTRGFLQTRHFEAYKEHQHLIQAVNETGVRQREAPTLGHLRNLALDRVSGTDLVVIWDDDDWMAPNYIETMVNHYVPGRISLMRHQLKHDLDFNTSFVARNSTGWHGQAIFDAATPHRYPHLQRGEDTAFRNLFGDRVIVFDNDPAIYVRTVHANNTWSRQHIMGRLCGQRDRHDVSPTQLALIREVRKLYGRDQAVGGGHAEEAQPETTGG